MSCVQNETQSMNNQQPVPPLEQQAQQPPKPARPKRPRIKKPLLTKSISQPT